MQIFMSDKTSPRSFQQLWYIRLVALLVTLIVLGITAANTATFHSIGCDAPGRLLYNLAVSILSFIALIYFILASGPSPTTRLLPWFIWGQLALDALIHIFWLSAAATSTYSCADLCSVCGIADGYVYFNSQSCACYDNLLFKRDYSPKPGNMLQSRTTHSNGGKSGARMVGLVAAKQTFDAIMTILFTMFVAADIFWIIRSRRTGASTITAPINGLPMKVEEAGMPMSGVEAPIYTQQPNPGYNGYNGEMAPQAGHTGEPTQYQEPPAEQQMLQESYSGSQYSQVQTQSQSNQPQYSIQPVYPQEPQISPQCYHSPQGMYPPQSGAPVPQQTIPQQVGHLGAKDGDLAMRSPTEEAKTNNLHEI